MKIRNIISAGLVALMLAVVVWMLLGRGNPKNAGAYLTRDDPTLGVTDLGPRTWQVIDVHEHLKGDVEAQQLITAMDAFGITRTCLMASTIYTLTLNPIYGFEGFKENNESVIAVKKRWPGRFCAFVTLNPLDDGNLELLKDYVARGADGLKLYVGHGASTPKFAFHSMAIDDPRLEPIFAYAEAVQLPIVLHVNLVKFWDELLHVLEKHPYLRVDIPHLGLYKDTEQRLKRLAFLLERYPNTYTDVSFGHPKFQLDGFEVLAKNRSRSRAFLTSHRDKVLYGSDMVLVPTKDEPYILNSLRSYMQFLEKERWRCFLVPSKTMYGMGLDEDTLRHIYEVAPKNFLLLDEKGDLPDRSKGWPIPRLKVPKPAIPPLDPAMIPPLKNSAAAPSAPDDTDRSELLQVALRRGEGGQRDGQA